MSDDPIREPPTTPAGIWEHPCEHNGCVAWGGWGYQIGKQKAHWFCTEHRAEGERFIGR